MLQSTGGYTTPSILTKKLGCLVAQMDETAFVGTTRCSSNYRSHTTPMFSLIGVLWVRAKKQMNVPSMRCLAKSTSTDEMTSSLSTPYSSCNKPRSSPIRIRKLAQRPWIYAMYFHVPISQNERLCHRLSNLRVYHSQCCRWMCTTKRLLRVADVLWCAESKNDKS